MHNYQHSVYFHYAHRALIIHSLCIICINQFNHSSNAKDRSPSLQILPVTSSTTLFPTTARANISSSKCSAWLLPFHAKQRSSINRRTMSLKSKFALIDTRATTAISRLTSWCAISSKAMAKTAGSLSLLPEAAARGWRRSRRRSGSDRARKCADACRQFTHSPCPSHLRTNE